MRETLFVRFNTLQFALATGNCAKYWPTNNEDSLQESLWSSITVLTNEKPKKTVSLNLCHAIFTLATCENSKLIQNGGLPNIFSFHIIHGSCLLWVMSTEISVDIAVDIAVVSLIHYTLFSSLKKICHKKDFHVAWQTCWWKRPFHVGCQDKRPR